PPPPPPTLAVNDFKAEFVDVDGKPIGDSVFRVTNIVSTNLYALLNFVFFDDSSAVIPDRYSLLSRDEAARFQVGDLNGRGTMPIYYHMLNIVGKKLQASPATKITLTGCNSNDGREKNALELSKARAEAVRDYFVNVWNIDPSRIAVKARNLPETPSNPTRTDGMEENRRVEITTTDQSILEPLFFTDTTRTSNAPIIRFAGNVTSEAGVREVRVKAMQGNRE
ncbi:MAG TPA: hypothetical protein DIS79_08095, partial [Bacteroidetes bacterium]|nr:hypothetical protein [Bacteroidota bacterium]